MSLVIRMDENVAFERAITVEHIFYVNDLRKRPNIPVEAVTFLQADGHELDYIKARFCNIPYSYGICKWYDEMARFIFANIF